MDGIARYVPTVTAGTAWNSASQPISRVLSWTIIYLGCLSPDTSSNLPESSTDRTNGFLFGLAPGGVYRAVIVANHAVRSYHTFSPLLTIKISGLFSVALSVGLRLPGVTWRLILWSPDFPPSLQRAIAWLTWRNHNTVRRVGKAYG
jgi:hypothetical protein